MSKIRVPVYQTVGKSVRVNPDATKGATLGTDLLDANGNVLTKETLAELLGVTETPAIAQAVTPANDTERKIKTADTTYDSETLLTDDGHLVGFELEADTWYTINGYLEGISNFSADFKLRLSFTNTPADGSISYQGADSGGAFIGRSATSAISTVVLSVTGSTFGLRVSGAVKSNASTGGTVDLQHAQNTSAVTTTGLRSGSWLEFTKA